MIKDSLVFYLRFILQPVYHIFQIRQFVYRLSEDDLSITLSDHPATLYRKSGHLVFAFSDNNELVSLHLVGLTEADVSHVRSELTL